MTSDQEISEIADKIDAGGVGLLPTDTNYGLCADPYNIEACEKLYALKSRDAAKKLSLFIAEPEDVFEYTSLTKENVPIVKQLVEAHWPGPFGIVLRKNEAAPSSPYIDEQTIAFCRSRNRNMNRVVRKLGRPVGVTSANISGVHSDRLIDLHTARANFPNGIDFFLEDEDEKFFTMDGTIVAVDDSGRVKVLRQGDIKVGL